MCWLQALVVAAIAAAAAIVVAVAIVLAVVTVAAAVIVAASTNLGSSNAHCIPMSIGYVNKTAAISTMLMAAVSCAVNRLRESVSRLIPLRSS